MTDHEDITVDGVTHHIVNLGPTVTRGTPAVTLVLLGDTVEELQHPDARQTALRQLLASVQRRNITPKGFWCLGTLPIDWPLWRDYIRSELAEQIEAQQREIDGHTVVYALIDSAKVVELP